jgi:exosome complex component RRP4
MLKKEIEEIQEKSDESEKNRDVVVPGEVIAKGKDLLPGEGTRREGEEIIASRFGLLDKTDRLVKVIPLSGAYIPRAGNTIIGQIIDVSFNGWIIDVLSTYQAFLSVSECFGYINKKDLTEVYDFNDIIVTKIWAVKPRSIELTMKEKGLRKLEGGMLIKINPTRVPRIIGKAGSMVKTIKDETNCNIIVGQNGLVWIKGENVEQEIIAKKAIEMIVEKPFQGGLTEKVKEFLEKLKKPNK